MTRHDGLGCGILSVREDLTLSFLVFSGGGEVALVGVQTRLSWEEYEAIQALAEDEHRSLSQSVRLLVRDALERRELLDSGVNGSDRQRAEEGKER